MPRGDLMYRDDSFRVMRKNRGMPPSHNCVWVEGNRNKFEENFEDIFGKKDKTNGGYKCTCNFSEGILDGNTYMFVTDCKLHGPAKKKKINVSKKVKDFSARQLKKAREYVIYGNSDIREVTNRNG